MLFEPPLNTNSLVCWVWWLLGRSMFVQNWKSITGTRYITCLVMVYHIHSDLILGYHWFLSTTYGLMDIIDPHKFIDVGLFVNSSLQRSDACFEYWNKRNKMGNFIIWPKKYKKKLNTSKQEPYATQTFKKQYTL